MLNTGAGLPLLPVQTASCVGGAYTGNQLICGDLSHDKEAAGLVDAFSFNNFIMLLLLSEGLKD